MRKSVALSVALIFLCSLAAYAASPSGKATSTWGNIKEQAASALAPGKNKPVKNALRVPGDYLTIQEAIDDAQPGDTILVGPGEYFGATVTKAVQIKGTGRAIINDGPKTHSFLRGGFFFPNSDGTGATISGFRFVGQPQLDYVDDGKLDFPIFSRGADDVTVKQNVMVNSLQAITNWGGSGWNISHNEITDLGTLNGGGIGIFIGDNAATAGGIANNLVSHNKISGTLHVAMDDGGGYNGTGIVLYADFRWGRLGAEAISNNRVIKNKIALVSDTPDVVDVCAIELTDTGNDAVLNPVVFDNAIGFNDLRGTEIQIVLTPEELGEVNSISRNLGDNRGHGLHPNAFK